MSDLSNPAQIKKILGRHGFTFSKALGQNFIINPDLCPAIAEYGVKDENSGVIEIGAGIGVLTEQLSIRAAKVVTLEVDTRLLPVLAETLKGRNNVEVLNADIMKTDLKALVENHFASMPVSVCANLPYYITSPVIMLLLESGIPFENITVMVQKEAGDRLCAPVGSKEAGAVTCAVSYYADAEKLIDVPKTDFLPSPKVDSCVIRLTPRKEPLFEIENERFFFSIIKAAFAQRRKTALNSLSAGLGLPKDKTSAMLDDLGFEQTVRAEKFTMDDFKRIYDYLV